MDFVSDALFDGRRLRLLTVIDLYTRECLGICRPLPQLLKTDNGLPFESTVFAHKDPAI
ncbi:hypothetical protein HJ586_05770 [Dickeya zeae]|nr:hypothetical protein HJ586_05770 [Dickeya zeae]